MIVQINNPRNEKNMWKFCKTTNAPYLGFSSVCGKYWDFDYLYEDSFKVIVGEI